MPLLINELDELINFRLYCSQGLKLPQNIDEERLLCITAALHTITNKICAFQPPQEKVTLTIKNYIEQYFTQKNLAQETLSAEEFDKILAHSGLIGNFIKNPAITNISEHIKKTVESNSLKNLRKNLLKTNGKTKLTPSIKPEQISNGDVCFTEEEARQFWQKIASAKGRTAESYKNAFIEGKYIILLEENTLKALLTDSNFYTGLNTGAIKAAVEIIEEIIPLMSKEEKQKLLPLTNNCLRDYRGFIFNISQDAPKNNYGIMDLFSITDAKKMKDAVLTFSEILIKEHNELFYIDYDINSVDDSTFEKLDYIIDTLAELLQEDFLKQDINADIDLWASSKFRIIWLLTVIWFKKAFTEIKQRCSA